MSDDATDPAVSDLEEGAHIAEGVGTGMEVAGIGGEVAALGGVAAGTAVAGVGLAAGVGVATGELIEHETGAGSAAGDWLYDHSNPHDAAAAADSFDQAGQDWDHGNYLDAAGDVAGGVGHMAEGLWDGLTGSSSDEGSSDGSDSQD